MRATFLAAALLMSGTAIAQTTPDVDADVTVDTSVEADTTVSADADVDTTTHSSTMTHDQSTMTMASNTMPASAQVVQPSNADPERDARGIAVISAPAMVPAGWNGVTGTAMGGPLVDPATGETVSGSDTSYPACTATVTDNCVQTYERGRSR